MSGFIEVNVDTFAGSLPAFPSVPSDSGTKHLYMAVNSFSCSAFP